VSIRLCVVVFQTLHATYCIALSPLVYVSLCEGVSFVCGCLKYIAVSIYLFIQPQKSNVNTEFSFRVTPVVCN
jgi:hypothetical protein